MKKMIALMLCCLLLTGCTETPSEVLHEMSLLDQPQERQADPAPEPVPAAELGADAEATLQTQKGSFVLESADVPDVQTVCAYTLQRERQENLSERFQRAHRTLLGAPADPQRIQCNDFRDDPSVLTDAQIPFDKKNCNPHITLLRRAQSPRTFSDAAVARERMTVQRISLMRSDFGRHGAAYTELGAVEAPADSQQKSPKPRSFRLWDFCYSAQKYCISNGCKCTSFPFNLKFFSSSELLNTSCTVTPSPVRVVISTLSGSSA